MRSRAARTAILAAIAALCATWSAAASAATVSLDRACYKASSAGIVTITGQGFTPGEQYTVLVQGGVVDVGTAAADGSLVKRIPVPLPPDSGPGAHTGTYSVEVQQVDNDAKSSFQASAVYGDFTPGSGDPRTLRVHFIAYGFGTATPAGQPMPTVYVHYIDPRGKLRKTVAIGAGTAPCGTIKRTALRKLFPFTPRSGTWTLQYDTQQKYVKGTPTTYFPFDRFTLTISAKH
ncbi:MAG TPA: hypothetical protein VMT10_00770 [Solirubrobacteraceae bacterium]|nr:hypothetical protein [Solirubrobacteraceae bacterium]